MGGKIWLYDCYDLRKFRPGDIHTFVDIGAQIGVVTLQAKVLNPIARVVAFEPCKETFETLERNMQQWKGAGIECYNVAFGNGFPMCYHNRGGARKGKDRFYTEDEKQWWPQETYMMESKTLPQIFEDYKIDRSKPYIIKMDCEGGERFLLQEEFRKESLELIRGSVQTMMELHITFGGTKKQWNTWFEELKDTHELRVGGWTSEKWPHKRYLFTICNGLQYEKGYHSFELINREWIGPWHRGDL